jgi:hypothetical protein
VKPSAIASSIETLIRIRRPGFIWGPPGVGKSDVVGQVAKKNRLRLLDVRAVLFDPVDLRGLPYIAKGLTHWSQPDLLPRDGEGILFLDELPQATALVQNACLQLVLDRKLGEYTLPDGWTIIAAGNRETDRAHTTKLSSALSSRFRHFDFEVDLDDWTKHALAAGFETEVVAFCRFRPALLHAFDAKARTFPCPRTWEFTSENLAAGPAKEIEYDLAVGTVGQEAAAEFMGFLRVFRRLPNPDAVMMNPTKAEVPTDPATLYALAGALARKCSTANFDRAIQYADRMPKEFGVLLVRDAIARTPDLQNTRPFIEWASRNADVLI